nr:MAG TPA: hypothetical protein [Caudoviricetes sp.]
MSSCDSCLSHDVAPRLSAYLPPVIGWLGGLIIARGRPVPCKNLGFIVSACVNDFDWLS